MTRAWVTEHRASQSRQGYSWRTIPNCANVLLTMIATCSLGRSHESRKIPKLHIRSVWSRATPSRTKMINFWIQRLHNYSILPKFCGSLLFPIQTPTASKYCESTATASLGLQGKHGYYPLWIKFNDLLEPFYLHLMHLIYMLLFQFVFDFSFLKFYRFRLGS